MNRAVYADIIEKLQHASENPSELTMDDLSALLTEAVNVIETGNQYIQSGIMRLGNEVR